MRSIHLGLGIVSALFLTLIICMGNFSNYGAGHTGAPGENICKTCHTIPTAGMSGGYLLNGLPANVVGGQTYPISMRIYTDNELAQTAGFQMNFLNGDGTSHGNLSESDTYVSIAQHNGRTYAQQVSNPRFFSDFYDDTVYFEFQWTPEAVDVVTPVQSYFGTAIGNGNYDFPGGQRGDSIYMGTRNINVVPLLTADISVLSTPECNGGNEGSLEITHDGGLAPIMISWSTGANGMILNDVPAGMYSATVTDAIGQQVLLSAEVTEPPLLTIDIQPTNPSCYNTTDGILAATPTGGTPPYSYLLDGQAITNPVFNLGPGTYNYGVVDSKGCMNDMDVNLESPDSIDIDLIDIVPQTAQSGGAIVIELSGGSSPYDFFWTGPNDYTGTTQNPIDLEAGNYMLTVTDANGCTKTFTASVEFASATGDLDRPDAWLLLSPNPGTSLLQVDFPENLPGDWHIQCISQNGQTISSLDSGQAGNTIITEQWNEGIYVIIARHSDSGTTLVNRWIKMGE